MRLTTVLAAFAALQAPLAKRSHAYKELGSLKIELDVYRAEDDTVRPVLVVREAITDRE